MKLSKVFSLIKKEKELLIQTGVNDSQWIGTTRAIYQISGLPTFTADNLFQLMGVAEDKKEKFTLYENGFDIALDDLLKTDEDAQQSRLHINYGLDEYIPVSTSQGLVFIDGKYLEPAYDMPQLRLYERSSRSGDLYIVVKSGMWIFAVIEPTRVLSPEIVAELDGTARCAKAKLKYYQGESENEI